MSGMWNTTPGSGGRPDLAQLERQVREHLDGLARELHAAAEEFRAGLRPSAVARRHPLAAALVGGAAILALAAWWRRWRRPIVVAAPAPETVEPARRVFRRSLVSGLARAAGRALPEILFLGLLGRRRRGRGRAKTS